MEKIALVTGSNKGIGFEVVKQLANKNFKVILTARDEEKGREAIKKLNNKNVIFHKLDVTSEKDIKDLFNFIKKEFNQLDVLINNAGILIDRSDSIMNTNIKILQESIETNTFAPFLISQTFIPIMKKGSKIINVSSTLGQLSEMNAGYTGYRMSKTALNALTRLLADEFKDIQVNSVCPGWVKTDMGGKGAPKSIEEGAETIVWLATENNKDSGKFFRDKKEISW